MKKYQAFYLINEKLTEKKLFTKGFMQEYIKHTFAKSGTSAESLGNVLAFGTKASVENIPSGLSRRSRPNLSIEVLRKYSFKVTKQ